MQTIAERYIAESGILETDRFWARSNLQWHFLATAGLVVRRAALEEIGGFDLSFGRDTGEDADLCWRLSFAGWELRYMREVEVIHHHRATLRGLFKQVHWYGQSSSALFARWRNELGWWRYTDRPVYSELLRGLLGIIPGLLLGRTRYEKIKPLLKTAETLVFLAGKYRGSLRHRVWFL